MKQDHNVEVRNVNRAMQLIEILFGVALLAACIVGFNLVDFPSSGRELASNLLFALAIVAALVWLAIGRSLSKPTEPP